MEEKKHWIIATSITIPVLLAIGIWGHNELSKYDNSNADQNNSYSSYDSDYKKYNSYDSDDYKNDMNDWYHDQAAGKDYDYDDGGSYYCMGKNDTCSRKTNNAYDLYCSSCDPDGDNREG